MKTNRKKKDGGCNKTQNTYKLSWQQSEITTRKEIRVENFPNFFFSQVDDFNHNDSEMRRQPAFSCVANMPTCDRKMKEGKLGL